MTESRSEHHSISEGDAARTLAEARMLASGAFSTGAAKRVGQAYLALLSRCGRDEAIEEAAKVADRFANDIGKLGFGCKDRKDLRGASVYFDQAKACRGVANAIRALVSAPKERDSAAGAAPINHNKR